jgi:hypothetical protein
MKGFTDRPHTFAIHRPYLRIRLKKGTRQEGSRSPVAGEDSGLSLDHGAIVRPKGKIIGKLGEKYFAIVLSGLGEI